MTTSSIVGNDIYGIYERDDIYALVERRPRIACRRRKRALSLHSRTGRHLCSDVIYANERLQVGISRLGGAGPGPTAARLAQHAALAATIRSPA